MAETADRSADVASNLVSGLGTSQAVFTMPGNVAIDVESVFATIDNSAGSANTATLTIKDSAGQVIAKKSQGATVDAGASGSATWALQLADETASLSGLRAQYGGNDVTLTSNATTYVTWDHKFLGPELLDRSTLNNPKVLAAGVYIVSIWLSVTLGAGETAYMKSVLDESGEDAEASADFVTQSSVFTSYMCVTQGYYVPAGGSIRGLISAGPLAANRLGRLREANLQRLS